MISRIRKFRNNLSQYAWDLAYGDYCEDIIFDGFIWNKLHILKNPYKTKWFADPFILDVSDDTIQFLVEEFDSQVNRGRIARIVANRKTDVIEECYIILDLPTHLSFPVIYRIDGEIYVHPENSASGKSSLYRYDRIEDKLVEPTILVSDPLVDAIITEQDGHYRMYATRVPDAGGLNLCVYESEYFSGQYKQVDTLTYDRREARMAGAFIETSRGVIRPAQDCNRDYGEAVLFYQEKDIVHRQKSESFKYEGVHTFNINDRLFVIDLKKYNYPIIHQVVKWLKRQIRRR